MTAAATTTVVPRAAAVRAVANAIADRAHFVIAVPPDHVASVIDRLAGIPRGWTAYVDNGSPMVLVTGEPGAAVLLDLVGGAVVAVVTVPKTTSAAVLGGALSQPVPDDGSQDLVIIHDFEPGPMCWPMIFVDAIERVDPAVAAQLHASDIRSMS